MNKILEAAQFARDKHWEQKRKYNDRPYIEHPGRVAATASILFGTSEELVCAAWLHDVVEDCDVKIEEIEEKFGWEVAQLVLELTNVYTKKAYPELNRKRRKELENSRIELISPNAKILKLLDRIDNLREMKGAPNDFLEKYKKESKELLDVLRGSCAALELQLFMEIESCV